MSEAAQVKDPGSGPRAGRRRLRRWTVDAAVRLLLAGPGHRLLSGSLVVLTYRGIRTGRTHALPVQYARLGDDLVVVAAHSDGKTWWRNLAEAEVTVLLRGRRTRAHAEVVVDPVARQALLHGFCTRFRTFPERLGEVALIRLSPLSGQCFV